MHAKNLEAPMLVKLPKPLEVAPVQRIERKKIWSRIAEVAGVIFTPKQKMTYDDWRRLEFRNEYREQRRHYIDTKLF